MIIELPLHSLYIISKLQLYALQFMVSYLPVQAFYVRGRLVNVTDVLCSSLSIICNFHFLRKKVEG